MAGAKNSNGNFSSIGYEYLFEHDSFSSQVSTIPVWPSRYS
jgi:hypothetical protein